MTSRLYERTSELLGETLIPLTKIAKITGCNQRTLAGIRDKKHVPNVELCEAVYNFLSRDPLEVK